MIDPSPIIAPALQLLSAVAAVGRVRTRSYVVSRRFNALALGAVAADFAIKYFCTERADHLVGLVVFAILTARTLLLVCFETIEAEVFRRRLTCAAAFFACAVASAASEFAATGSLALVTLLPIVGIGLGCLGEASNAMVVRRRCVLAMGCIMSLFAISTGALGASVQKHDIRRRGEHLEYDQISGSAAPGACDCYRFQILIAGSRRPASPPAWSWLKQTTVCHERTDDCCAMQQ